MNKNLPPTVKRHDGTLFTDAEAEQNTHGKSCMFNGKRWFQLKDEAKVTLGKFVTLTVQPSQSSSQSNTTQNDHTQHNTHNHKHQ